MNGDVATGGAEFQQMMAVRDDMHERHGFFVEFVSSGFDPRQVENFI